MDKKSNLAPSSTSSTIERFHCAHAKKLFFVSEFELDQRRFLVAAHDGLEPDLELRTTILVDGVTFSVIGQFEKDRKRYWIVETEESIEQPNSHLTKLLTERELQITTLVASGASNKQIALQLKISEWTVSAHLRRIFIKLGVDSRAAMVYRCAALIEQSDRLMEREMRR